MKYSREDMEGNVNSKYKQISGNDIEDDNDNDNDNDDDISSTRSKVIPSLLIIHGALILAQVLFGGGSIIGKLGLPATNPVLFALIREGIGGPLLCIIAYLKDKQLPKLKDLKYFIGPGICLFLNQFCFIVGLKISSSITASAWQPSQGTLAVCYGFLFGIEREFDRFKIIGILISTGGALFMILYDNHDDKGNNDVWSQFGGSIMFFLNCSATVMYLILAKPVNKRYIFFFLFYFFIILYNIIYRYPTATITGYSYIFATFSMIIASLIIANVPSLLDGVCPDCNGKAWNVPTVTIYALIYWILAESVASYLLITWANKYADPSVNLAYSVLQPLTAVISAEILLIFNIVPQCHINSSNNKSNCIYGADWNDLGAIGIAIGLYLVIYSSRLKQKREKELQSIEENNLLPHAINDPSMKAAAVREVSS